jgi:DNA modification methylase
MAHTFIRKTKPQRGKLRVKLLCGEALALLKERKSNSFDALMTDPPAGIGFMGKEWDDYRRARNPADAGRDNVFGRTSRTGPEYGRARDGFLAMLAPILRECLRVLKPGAHGLVWALPRTSHWTATALEDAGFEVRDVITHHFGSGFPKSLDVSKAIDKAAGAEREVVGVKPGHEDFVDRSDAHAGGGRSEGWDRPWRDDPQSVARSHMTTAPATDAAKRWQGWGTALKPATEHWILVRKPLAEGTVAANVLAHGVGALNIDRCRIRYESESDQASARPQGRATAKAGALAGKSQHGGDRSEFVPDNTKGRWPANLILDEFAAHEMDRQSGERASPWIGNPNIGAKGGQMFGGADQADVPKPEYRDRGGASRFFYCAKASRSERGPDNTHPTVKPLTLMRWLCRLITPPGGLILDPFMGSGTTGVAGLKEGFRFVGIEREEGYFKIAQRRIFEARGRVERV